MAASFSRRSAIRALSSGDGADPSRVVFIVRSEVAGGSIAGSAPEAVPCGQCVLHVRSSMLLIELSRRGAFYGVGSAGSRQARSASCRARGARGRTVLSDIVGVGLVRRDRQLLLTH